VFVVLSDGIFEAVLEEKVFDGVFMV